MNGPSGDGTASDLTPATWERAGLEGIGFDGFVPLATLEPAVVPDQPGVYLVLREPGSAPEFLGERPRAGTGADQAGAYPVEDLRARWGQ